MILIHIQNILTDLKRFQVYYLVWNLTITYLGNEINRKSVRMEFIIFRGNNRVVILLAL